jgi:Tfp pilus assembly pilus retraction ATPase PilT
MTPAAAIADLQFVDLWLGHDYAEYTEIPGANAPLHQLSGGYAADVAHVRELCAKAHSDSGDSGFTIDLATNVLARVTVLHDLRNEPTYVLRRITSEIRQLQGLGLPRLAHDHIIQKETRGLILICGEQGTGKTTTASAILSARLHAHGGRALAVEDPPEVKLDGRHGPGRCIQVPVSRRHGTYVEQIRNGMRTGTSLLMIGEIRSADTAREAVQASVNGMTVVTTIHGADALDGLRRLVTFAQGSEDGLKNASDLLASGLAAVVHQRIAQFKNVQGTATKALFSCLTISPSDPGHMALRSKVKEGAYTSLADDIAQQQRRQQFAG